STDRADRSLLCCRLSNAMELTFFSWTWVRNPWSRVKLHCAHIVVAANKTATTVMYILRIPIIRVWSPNQKLVLRRHLCAGSFQRRRCKAHGCRPLTRPHFRSTLIPQFRSDHITQALSVELHAEARVAQTHIGVGG